MASVLYVAGVVPSVLIGWVTWRALRTRPVMGIEAMLGEAITDLAPLGQVRYRNDPWTALAAEPVRRGERVRIEALHGLQLRVVPEQR